jgi:O-antigen/teichoic acid export membrane protein
MNPVTPRANLATSMAYFGSINVIAFCAGVIRQKVFAVFLAPIGLGALGLAASFFELFTTLVRLGAPVGFLREFTRSLSDGDRSRAARVFRDVQRIVVLLALALGAAVTLVAPALTDHLFAGVLPWWTIPVLAAAAPIALTGELRHSAINGLGQTRMLALATVVTVLLGLVVAVWLVATFELAGAILQLAAGALIALLVSQGFLSRIFRPTEHNPGRVPSSEARRAVAETFQVGTATAAKDLAATANLFVFRSMIVTRLGAFENGLYQGTMAVSHQYTTAILSGVFVYLYPRLVVLAGRPDSFARELSKSAGFALALVVPISLALIATRDWIVRIVFTSEFSGMIPLMAYSFSGDILTILVGVFRIALLASGRAWLYIVIGLLGEGLYLGAFLGGLRVFGLAGATRAYLAAGVMASALYGIVLARRGEFKLPKRLVLQLLLLLPLIGAAIASPPGIWISRVLALSFAVGWLWIWRNELLSGLRN